MVTAVTENLPTAAPSAAWQGGAAPSFEAVTNYGALGRDALDGTAVFTAQPAVSVAEIGAANEVSQHLNGALKRAFDLVFGLVLFAALLPIALIGAVAVKLSSPGPVIYRQQRVGLDGRVFDVLKFRSMRVDAEKNGPQWASMNDNRITPIGRVIRKWRIDEIPQLWNVLRGEMSLVGPRPERPEFIDVLEQEIPFYQARHRVKPGITGWAQVKYHYTASVDGAREKLKYDLHYIRNVSFMFDLAILVLTLRVVLLGIGSR